jgi:beta-lactamase class A
MVRITKSAVGAALLLGIIAGSARTQDKPAAARIERLKMQIEREIRRADGQVGVAVKHIETGESLAVNGDKLFPMASTFKVPVLVELLYQVKEGRYGLEDEITVQESDQHIGSGMISKLTAPGIKLSVRNMAHFMMMISDNSAADILLEKVGADNVNARLKGLGITGISVNRSCQKLIRDLQAVMSGARTPSERKAALVKFAEDPQDESSPLAMNSLLEKIFKKEIASPELSTLALEILRKCETGEKRIKGELPQGTVVAHKTGTLTGTVDDCGIIYLPDGQGHVVLTVFTKELTSDTEDVEAIIAKIARLAYDYFYFLPGSDDGN